MFGPRILRYTRVFREGFEEGRKEGHRQRYEEYREEGRQAVLRRMIPRLVTVGVSLEQIAEAAELSVEQVKAILESQQNTAES